MKTPIALWTQNFCHHEQKRVDQLFALLKKKSFLTWPEEITPNSICILTFDRAEVIPDLCTYLLEMQDRSPGLIIVVGILSRDLLSYEYWQLLKSGAAEIITYPKAKDLASKILAKISRWHTIEKLLDSPKVQLQLIGKCPKWLSIIRQIIEVACYTDAPVLIQGESGTGKELVARLIHNLDARPQKGSLITLDCTTVVPDLSGSEFFGHEKGAFTHAVSKREGAFALANRGTLFLDEIGELPLSLQPELLRVVQEGTYKSVGSNTWQSTTFRLICATNRTLNLEVSKGNFRQDLYYRIATWVFTLPTLSDRIQDIPLLVNHFLSEFLQTEEVPIIEPPVMHFLITRDYPGNIRELRQVVRRIACRHVGAGPISIGDISEEDQQNLPDFQVWEPVGWDQYIRRALASGVSLKKIKQVAGDLAMEIAIQHESGNLQQAARRLGVSDRTLQLYRANKLHTHDRKPQASTGS